MESLPESRLTGPMPEPNPHGEAGFRDFDPDANRSTGDTAFLMDAAGARTVTVRAKTSILGTLMTATTRISFGTPL